MRSFCQEKLRLNFSNLKFEFFKRPEMDKWSKQSCRSQKIMQPCSWQLFCLKLSMHGKIRLNFLYLKFKILKRPRIWCWNDQNKSSRSREVIQLCSWQLFHLKSSCLEKLCLNFSNFVNDLGWRNYQNESCRSQKVIQLCSWQLFDLKSFCLGNLSLNFSNLKFEFLKYPQMVKWPKRKL